jgi:TolB protein
MCSLRSLLLLSMCGWASVAEAVTIESTTRLTSDPSDQYNPVISGEWVVYTDVRNGNADVFLYHLTTGTETNLTNDPANQLLNDVRGDYVVYSDYRTGVGQIFAYHLPSAMACQLTFTSRTQIYPALGGDIVVFQDQNGSDTDIGAFDLNVLDTADFAGACAALATGQLGGARTLPLGPGRHLAPKASERFVVYQGFNDAGEARLYAFERRTETIRAFPEHGKSQIMADLDGSRVAYVEDDGIARDVVFFDLDTDTFIKVTDDAYRQSYPSISGNFIAFEDGRNGNLDIMLYDLSTGLLTALTSDPANQYLNSVEGTRVVFTDSSAGNLDVVLVTFSAEMPEIPAPCVRVGEPQPITDTNGRLQMALDDEARIVRRELIVWPFLGYSLTAGRHTSVSDHQRLVYSLDLEKDEPQAMVTLHARLVRSKLPDFLLARGDDSRAGIVMRVGGIERRWEDPSGALADVMLSAKRTSAGAIDTQTTLNEARVFFLPPEIAVTAGNAGNAWLALTVLREGEAITCRYKGGAPRAHPQGFFERALGRRYVFSSCDDRSLRASDTFSADAISLHVEGSDDRAGDTEVTLRLYAESSAGDDTWRDIAFATPLPLFAGHNEVVLEGMGYGSTYLKYRPVSFADGGTLEAYARPACVEDPTLVPACHRSDAKVLVGPTVFVRHGGPIETTTVSYASAESGAAIVCVKNGDGDGLLRASSALVTHSGLPVLGPNAFGPAVAEVAAPVVVHAQNSLSVELRSTPGSFITVKVVSAPPELAPSDKPETIVLRGCAQATDGGSALFLGALWSWTRLRRRRLMMIA